MQEIDNAVNQTKKEIAGRFDFRGGKSDLELDKAAKEIKITADDEFKLRSMHQILEQKLTTRKVDLKVVEYGDPVPAPGQVLRQTAKLKEGIDKEEAKKILKLIKDSALKVQAQIQDEQVRVTGKKIDDLQAVIQMLRSAQVAVPLQYVNMRS
jgi:uncharacterized protein YajQ (UPF0234 family)